MSRRSRMDFDTLERRTRELTEDSRYHQLIMWGGGYGKKGWKEGDPVDMDYIRQTQQAFLEFVATMKTAPADASAPHATYDRVLGPSHSVSLGSPGSAV